MARYNNSVVTKEDFEREMKKKLDRELSRFDNSKRGRFLATVAGFDADMVTTPAHNQDE